MNMSHYSSEYIDLAAILGIKRLVDEKLENDLSPLKIIMLIVMFGPLLCYPSCYKLLLPSEVLFSTAY